MVVRVIATLVVVCCLVGLGGSVAGAQIPIWAPSPYPCLPYYAPTCAKQTSGEAILGVRKLANSFTSYQFPNPFPPNQDPLSRLEFPIDQWFVGIKAGYSLGCLSLLAEGWTNVNQESGFQMQDSDWDDDQNPSQKTIFSESKCTLNGGYMADIGLAIGRGCNPVSIRPIAGCRFQYFDFTTHDGIQMDANGNVADLPGKGIKFQQSYQHYFLGGIFKGQLGTFRSPCYSRALLLTVQGDAAVVDGRNEDRHLLRAGDRVTEERTKGYCWHVALGTSLDLSNLLRLRLEGDFKRITTTGSHNLSNPAFNIDFSFDGAKAWSDQASITAMGELRF